jgi:Protein of unknown function (DUF3105)
VASRKEQKEKLRRERLEREQEAAEQARRKRMVGYGVGGALAAAAAIAVVAVLVLGGDKSEGKVFPSGGKVPDTKVTDLPKAAAAAGCRLSSEKAQSRNHETDPTKKLPYRTNPPTDGKHYEVAEPDGVYDKAPPDSHLVHNLEHGRIIVWVTPSLSENDRKDLRALIDEDSYQMVLVPRSNMPFQVATSAWGRDPEPLGTGFLMGCPHYGEKVFDAIRAFREEHRSNGPEPVP